MSLGGQAEGTTAWLPPRADEWQAREQNKGKKKREEKKKPSQLDRSPRLSMSCNHMAMGAP